MTIFAEFDCNVPIVHFIVIIVVYCYSFNMRT